MFKEDTVKLMQRDAAEFKRKQKEIKDKVSAALEGYPDSMIYTVLHSTLLYGFKMSNGQWHPAPERYSSKIITEGKPVNVET